MKSHKRERQKQSARLYLRKNDHRDAIYNNIFHNALLWVDEDGETHYWIKYPKRAICFNFTGLVSGSSNNWYYGIIDPDRQFCHAYNLNSGSERGIRRIGNFVLNYSMYNTRQVNMSLDGSMFLSLTITGEDGRYGYLYPIGEQLDDETNARFCIFQRASNYQSFDITVYEITEFNEDDIQVTTRRYTTIYSFTNWFYMKPTDTGLMLFMIRSGSNSNQIIEFTETGYNVVCDFIDWKPIEGYSQIQSNPAYIGDKITFIRWYDASAYPNGVFDCKYSTDNGRTWYGHELLRYSTDYSYARACVCARNGAFYYYCVEDRHELDQSYYFQLHVFKTTDFSTFEELTVPDYCDVNVMWAGKCTEKYPEIDTVRILNSSNASDGGYYTKSIKDLLGTNINDNSGSIEFIDGEIQRTPQNEFLVMYADYSSSEQLVVYIDNMIMDETTNNFAFITPRDMASTDGADPCIQEDYCVPYDTPTPFDPSQYAFWDYYKWNSEIGYYERVMRVDLKYYPNWHVIVVEYLPQTGANNVLYKVPRNNV